MQTTLGIDLAAQPKNTALCVIAWDGGGAELRALAHGAWDGRPLDNALVTRAIRGVEALAGTPVKTAIDAPFGWPERFVEAVAAHHRLEPWPADFDGRRRSFERRLTDVLAHERAKKLPLSVSTDRIAYCAMRCAAILGALAEEEGSEAVARDGSGRVIEAYPDAALRCWLPREWTRARESYKGDGAHARRERLLSALLEALGPRFRLGRDERASCVRSDDSLDALVCALLARAAQRGRTIAPEGDEQRRLARSEGWIHLPRAGSLSALV